MAVTPLTAGVVALIAHELGHIAVTLACGLRVTGAGISRKGLYIRRQKGTPKQNIAVALGGPLANLMLVFTGGGVIWITVNLVLVLVNLLPIPDSDGQHVLTEARRTQ